MPKEPDLIQLLEALASKNLKHHIRRLVWRPSQEAIPHFFDTYGPEDMEIAAKAIASLPSLVDVFLDIRQKLGADTDTHQWDDSLEPQAKLQDWLQQEKDEAVGHFKSRLQRELEKVSSMAKVRGKYALEIDARVDMSHVSLIEYIRVLKDLKDVPADSCPPGSTVRRRRAGTRRWGRLDQWHDSYSSEEEELA